MPARKSAHQRCLREDKEENLTDRKQKAPQIKRRTPRELFEVPEPISPDPRR